MIRIDTLAGDGDRILGSVVENGSDAAVAEADATLAESLRALLQSPSGNAEAPAVGAMLGEFEVLETLSAPGRPLCVRAKDPFYEGIETRELALKELPRGDLKSRARAIRTQSVVAQAGSDCAAEIFGFHVEADRAFVVRRFVQGVPLSEILQTLKQEEVPPDSPTWRLAAGARGGGANVTGAKIVCRIGQYTAKALVDVGAKGAIHGCLKPANLVCDDTVKPTVVDFGCGEPVAPYEAPEVIRADDRAEARDAAADLYSLGVILHESLTRRPIFGEGSAAEIEQRTLTDKPDKPTKHNFKASKEMTIISLALLEKDPARRFANAAELHDDLDRYHRNDPIRRKAGGLLSRLFG